MSAISTHVGLLIALFAILLLHPRRKVKPQTAAYGSQMMCPACGLITSRLKAYCLECGKSLTAVSVTPVVEK
jgi:predicted amidophosphoribosyltransferase